MTSSIAIGGGHVPGMAKSTKGIAGHPTFLLTAMVVSRAFSGLVLTYFLRASWKASEVTPRAVMGKSAETGSTLLAFSTCSFANRLCLCLLPAGAAD